MWKVLANTYSHTDIEFGAFGDKEGKVVQELGFEDGKSTVVFFQKDQAVGKKYTGTQCGADAIHLSSNVS